MPIPNPNLNQFLMTPTLPLCSSVDQSLIGWAEAEEANWGAIFDSVTGKMTAGFAAEICALPCVGGGTQTCPTVIVTIGGIPGNALVNVTVNGTGMLPGYTFYLYRETAKGQGSGGTLVYTGLTTGSVITYQDTGLNNGTPYWYYATVQDLTHSCALYSGESSTSFTPVACSPYTFVATAVAGTPTNTGSPTVILSFANQDGTPLPAGATYNIYRSTAVGTIGPSIATGVVGDGSHDCPIASVAGICYTDSDGSLAVGTNYQWTFGLVQSGCTNPYYVSIARVASVAGASPDFFIPQAQYSLLPVFDATDSNGIKFAFHATAGATGYRLYMRANGSGTAPGATAGSVSHVDTTMGVNGLIVNQAHGQTIPGQGGGSVGTQLPPWGTVQSDMLIGQVYGGLWAVFTSGLFACQTIQSFLDANVSFTCWVVALNNATETTVGATANYQPIPGQNLHCG